MRETLAKSFDIKVSELTEKHIGSQLNFFRDLGFGEDSQVSGTLVQVGSESIVLRYASEFIRGAERGYGFERDQSFPVNQIETVHVIPGKQTLRAMQSEARASAAAPEASPLADMSFDLGRALRS